MTALLQASAPGHHAVTAATAHASAHPPAASTLPAPAAQVQRPAHYNSAQSPERHQRHEVEAMEPDTDARKSGIKQTRSMCLQRFRHQHVFQRGALLADFQL